MVDLLRSMKRLHLATREVDETEFGAIEIVRSLCGKTRGRHEEVETIEEALALVNCRQCLRLHLSTRADYWQDALERWNRLADRHGLRRARGWTAARKQRLRARLEAHPRLWEELDRALGDRGTWARERAFPDLDQVLSEGICQRLLEGRYGVHLEPRDDPKYHPSAPPEARNADPDFDVQAAWRRRRER